MAIDRKPEYLQPARGSALSRHRVKTLLRKSGLHTVCESARCPNLGECFHSGTATFLILGDTCTRRCAFCAVKKGVPGPVDRDEPRRVAEAAARLGLTHVVVTSVTRDDLDDGGAFIFAETVRKIKTIGNSITAEILVPDFGGDESAIETVLSAMPDVFNHNVETVPRLYDDIRPGADWDRSLHLIHMARERGLATKSGMMLGMGETSAEIRDSLARLRDAGCRILTLGQYLAPTKRHWPVARHVEPAEFDEWRSRALEMGFREVFSSPLVRSSYHARPLG